LEGPVLSEAHESTLKEIVTAAGNARREDRTSIRILFTGKDAEDKSLAAELLSSAVGQDLYRVDLRQVVSKYIGETEKNLRRIFESAAARDVVLFFDEADALFGKRSEVKDAHDRYANLEISYLLEQMESYRGIAILAVNRKRDIDEAFIRRCRYVLDFGEPA